MDFQDILEQWEKPEGKKRCDSRFSHIMREKDAGLHQSSIGKEADTRQESSLDRSSHAGAKDELDLHGHTGRAKGFSAFLANR